MKSNTNSLRMNFLISICSVYFLMNSCSLIGFGIGASVDSRTPETIKIGIDHIDTLELEKRVMVIKNNGDTITGRYNGINPIYYHDYSIKYESIQIDLSNKITLPDLNDTLLILYNEIQAQRKIGLFKGIESGKLWCRYTYGDNYFSVCIDSIMNLTINNDYKIDSLQINSCILERSFPNFLHVNINTRIGDNVNIELVAIEKILIIDKRNRKFIGLGIGLAIDLIVAFIVADKNFNPGDGMSLY